MSFWVATADLPKSGGHPFYEKVNRILDAEGGDRHDEARGATLYADGIEPPSLAPAVCFRLMLVGSFEGLDSERGDGAARERIVQAAPFHSHFSSLRPLSSTPPKSTQTPRRPSNAKAWATAAMDLQRRATPIPRRPIP